MPTFSAATGCMLAAVLLGSAGCATPPVSPAPAPPAPPAPVAELAVDVFAPVEALLCVPVPLRFVVRNAGSQPVAGVHVHCELAEGLLAEDGRAAIDFDVGELPPGESAEALASAHASRTGRFELRATA